jgi:hypothetical protein
MAITQEREEMRTAQQLKQDGWVYHMFDNKHTSELREMTAWCNQSFGPMYNDMTWTGKWYGATLPFQTGGIDSKKQVVFMFRDDKLYTMFKVMFSER